MEPIGHNQSPARIHLQWFAEGPDTSGAGGEPQGGAAGAAAQGLFGQAGNGGQRPSDPPAGGEPSGQQGGQQGAAGTGDGNQPPAKPNTLNVPGYAQGLTKDMKADPRAIQYTAKYTSLDELVKAGMQLESERGKPFKVPTDKDPPEVIAAYRQAMAIPDKPESYKLDKVEGVPATVEEEKAFREMAHKYNIPQEAAAAFWKDSLVKAKAIIESAKQAEASQVAEREKALEAEWGTKYDENLEIAKRGASAYVKDDLREALVNSGLHTHPAVIRFFYELGMGTGEGQAPGAPAAGGSNQQKGFTYPGLK